MNVKKAKKMLIEENICEDNTDFMDAALVILGAVEVGANADKIAKWSNISRNKVRNYCRVLRKNNVFVGSNVIFNSSDLDEIYVEFCLYISLALEYVEIVKK